MSGSKTSYVLLALTQCYKIYARIVNFSAYKKLNAAKKELFETRQLMNATSAQDEFSKWAKLRRKVDKLTSEVDEKSRCSSDADKAISSGQFFFSILFKGFMFVLNMAIPTIISSYFSKSPMFFLPPGDWFGPLGYFFSFPKAPEGAVSTTIWTMVCGRVLSLVGAYCREVFVSDPEPYAPADSSEKTQVPVAEAPVSQMPAAEKPASEASMKQRRPITTKD